MKTVRAVLIGPRAKVSRKFVIQLRAATSVRGCALIAVDAGLAIARKAGFQPNFAVGDWDSLREAVGSTARVEKLLASVPHQTLPVKKDRSDTYYAIQKALRMGVKELFLFGLMEGRPDHHLAVLLDTLEVANQLHDVRAFGAEAEYHFITRTPNVKALPAGTLVSVFAMGGTAKGVTLRGFEYPLRNAALAPSSRGLSNRVTAETGKISIQAGKLLVIVPTEAK